MNYNQSELLNQKVTQPLFFWFHLSQENKVFLIHPYGDNYCVLWVYVRRGGDKKIQCHPPNIPYKKMLSELTFILP